MLPLGWRHLGWDTQKVPTTSHGNRHGPWGGCSSDESAPAQRKTQHGKMPSYLQQRVLGSLQAVTQTELTQSEGLHRDS